jgi:hypothetical protein
MGEAAVVLASTGVSNTEHASLVELTLGEEIPLRAYFARYVPPAPGSGSSFGGMCARLSNARNPATKELPTPFVVDDDGSASGAVWTEILDCGRDSSSAGDGEDAMIAHIDAIRCMARVRRTLSRLMANDQDVLDAHYASDRTAGPLGRFAGVAALTIAARTENRERAARGQYESIHDTLDSLARTARASASERAHTRALLASVRSESHSLLNAARTRYARAWRESR